MNGADDADLGPQITLFTKRDSPSLMSKSISLTDDGKIRSDGSECRMIGGTATRVFAGTAGALAQVIASCRSDQAIALGALKDGISSCVDITTKKRLNQAPGSIARTRDFIDYLHGRPAWALIDYDSKGMPPDIDDRIRTAGGMWQALLMVAPELAGAARVSRSSTSAGLFRSDTKQPIPGSDGMHHYILVRDAGDIERFLKDLHERCWLHGLGWHLIGRAGQLLDRSIVDRMVGSGERLCFEGAPLIVLPLAQDASKRVPQALEGEAICTDRAVPRLTEYERYRVNEAKEISKKALGKLAAQVRNTHDKELAEKIAAKAGIPMATSIRLAKARHRGVLYPDIELDFDHLGAVTVEAILTAPARYVGETLADPMEGLDYGRCKAMVMRGNDSSLFVHSFAHGGGVYLLRYDLKYAKAAFAQGGGTVDDAMAILAQAEIEADELDEFIRLVSKVAGVGIRPLNARIKKERKEWIARQASMKSKADQDGRIVRPRPDSNGELLPTVSFLDELLASDRSEEPPMRNASGAIVRVQEKEPWALHLLTADSANAEKEPEHIKPPAEPILVELSPTGVELLLERHIAWVAQRKDRTTYLAALPGPFIVALMEYPNSAIPTVRAINTSPLVTMTGRIIDGAGLDRTTGLFHRIDPALRACVPAGKPTDEEIKKALAFLTKEWLVDVALDDVGKCVAIMLALTILERALLPERPAFFTTAGHRGGGKTTLIHMIIAAVYGRRPAAAAWSENAEERKKSLFSYLREGGAVLVWDNIARGSTITCPHIEAALTAPEISDRVLGVSCTETVPATAVQIFTGNSIAPRGDMASRSFVLSLSVDRPDPENRSFTHPDPIAWTQANRTGILSALYTVLVGGILQRPEGQVAKTRFKLWWGLIGRPVEYAAGLLNIKLDCTELLRSNESKEEEASATSRVLTILKERWNERTFTTRDVVRVLEQTNSVIAKSAEQAEELFEALGELAGKTLDRPTARYIGKLFQKHLTNRPVWIDDEKRVAILRKDSGHQENQYTIEIPQTGGVVPVRTEATVDTSQTKGQASTSAQDEGTADGDPVF